MTQMSLETWQHGSKFICGKIDLKWRIFKKDEGINVSIYSLIKKFEKAGCVTCVKDIHQKSRPKLLTLEHYTFIDKAMMK